MDVLEALRCPSCHDSLPIRLRCGCGFEATREAGILNLLTPEDEREVREFCEVYEQVRLAEGWGGDDLDLPFHPKGHLDIWRIRQKTFVRLRSEVRHRFAKSGMHGVAVDIGAGNGWLTRYLSDWGFSAAAVDFNTSTVDGLGAAGRYLERGARFERIRGRMEALPFRDGTARLVTASASFHYAVDLAAQLKELRRVIAPDGWIAILDSPFYDQATEGERMLQERVDAYGQRYGVPEELSRRAGYFTYRDFRHTAEWVGLECEILSVWPGMRRFAEGIRGRVVQRRLAEFPVVFLRRESEA